MVNGASGLVGRTLVPVLLARDEVRACVRRPEAAEPLRALGTKVAVGRSDDADALAEILQRVHTLIHLVGGPNQRDVEATLAANHGSVLIALAAAREAGVRRFILVSAPGAATDAEHPYLRAKGLAEEAVANSRLEHAIIRSTHAYGLGGLWFTTIVEGALATPPFVAGDGDQLLAPILADDLAAVVAAADDRQSAVSGTWAIEGPEVLTTSDLVARLGSSEERPTALSPASAAVRLSEALGVPMSPIAAQYFTMPSRADALDAAAEFGVERTSLDAGLRLTMARAVASGR